MSSSILENLNEMQSEAVTTTEGPLLILAGAGSGKTKALTHRVAYLIYEKKISPQNILVVTFTNKASQEMNNRISKLISANPKSEFLISKQISNFKQPISKLPWSGTFHSICVKILRREIEILGFRRFFLIYDEDDSLSAVKHVMDALQIDKKQYNPKTIKNFISGAKNELIGPSEYRKFAKGYFGEIVQNVYERYQKDLKAANALDFDDLLLKTVDIFQKYPEILKRWQDIFQYILVDEYQDTNAVQYELINMLARKNQNICVVGDDFQAIYGFRGANFRNILNFEKDYPKAKIIKMEQNYRSTKNILACAQNVIEKNTERTNKKLWTENENGVPATVCEARNEADEVEFILNEIEALNRMFKYNQFVILYRTNAQSRVFEEALMDRAIPYRLIGALRFYERKEVKDILAYLKLLTSENDKVSLKRIINVPPRGIGKMTKYEERSAKIPKVEKFYQMMDEFRSASKSLEIADLIDFILRKTGYKDFLLDGTEEGEMRLENIEELKSVAEKSESLDDFLAKVALVSDIDSLDPGVEAITLMTLHNAKGLEFPIVFMVGMEEGLCPHSRSLTEPSEMEEERRLCYVGMTRAEKRLYLTYTQTRMMYGGLNANPPSRFIGDLPEDMIERI